MKLWEMVDETFQNWEYIGSIVAGDQIHGEFIILLFVLLYVFKNTYKIKSKLEKLSMIS
jgi:hypothetical protein